MLEKFAKENPKGTLGKLITILSIDGGGVRGLVPLVILIELEGILQRLDGAERRLADYFDIVAGTSTGGVITGLITTPASQDVPTRPLFTAKEVFNFYDRHATTLLPQTSTCDCRTPSSRANDLDRLLNRTFGTFPHLSSTITSVLIPSFDIRIHEPILFSSWQACTPLSLSLSLSFFLQQFQTHPVCFSDNSAFTNIYMNHPVFPTTQVQTTHLLFFCLSSFRHI
jgi:hypothetical protein